MSQTVKLSSFLIQAEPLKTKQSALEISLSLPSSGGKHGVHNVTASLSNQRASPEFCDEVDITQLYK